MRMCRLVLGGELQVVKCECADLFWAVSCRLLSAMCRLVLGGELQVVKCECADLFWAVSFRLLSANVPTCCGR